MQVVRVERDAQAVTLRFEPVPAYDLIMSLAAAAQPERYDLPLLWGRGVRTSLPAAVRRDLTFFFGGPVAFGIGATRFVPDVPAGDPAHLLRAVERIDPADFVATLVAPALAGRTLQVALKRAARGKSLAAEDSTVIEAHVTSLKPAARRRFREILADPGAMHARYLTLLRAHHDGWFASHYGEIAPGLEARARQARRYIGKLPVKEVIARATGGFTLEAPVMRTVLLVPSYYAAPFVVVVRDGADAILVYGARGREEAHHPPVDAHTVKVLRALGDETRLHILQLLAQRPLYGQQLASILGLSHPTVSHHMAQLRIAGLTRTELTVDGNKAYSVQPETVEALCMALRSAFVNRGGGSD